MVRRMGYISDQSGIYDRYARETENWNAHLESTKHYISDFIQNNFFQTATIFGSGWLLDLPVEFLSVRLKKILLCDVYHPPQIRQKLKKYDCFEMITTDITGGHMAVAYEAASLYRKSKKKTEIGNIEINGFTPSEETDCYISLNILNQLDILIVDFLRKQNMYTTEELNALRKSIQQSHLNSLPKNRSCLITDYEELTYRSEDVPEILKSLLYTELPDGKNVRTWKWLFDSTGSYNKGRKTVFKVIAMEI